MNRLKSLRNEIGMRQIDLAKQLGIGQSTLSGWENGQYEIDNENLRKIADLFECSIDYLLGKEDVKNTAAYYRELYKGKGHYDDLNPGVSENKENQYKVPAEFTDPEEARKYVGMHTIFGSEGFRADLMSDEDILDFANEMIRQAKLISYKYRK